MIHIEKLKTGYVLITENEKHAFGGFETMIEKLKSVCEEKDFSNAQEKTDDASIEGLRSVDIFRTIEAFESSDQSQRIETGKMEVEITADGKVRLYNTQYKINIFTTKAEIERLVAMQEPDLRALLSRYGQVAYANKAIVLRNFIEAFKGKQLALSLDFSHEKKKLSESH